MSLLQLIEQQSISRCVANVTFGRLTSDAMWVRRGCRGRFFCGDRIVSCGRPFTRDGGHRTVCICTDDAVGPCKVFVAQPNATPVATDAHHPHDQYAAHYWIQRALAASPWTTDDRMSADGKTPDTGQRDCNGRSSRAFDLAHPQ